LNERNGSCVFPAHQNASAGSDLHPAPFACCKSVVTCTLGLAHILLHFLYV
jgi:hypothetical protein